MRSTASTSCTRPLVDVAGRSQATALFGEACASPLCIAPTGLAGMLWHEGEIAIARAAAAAGIPFTLSTASITSIEDVAAKAGGKLWFQLYMWSQMEMSYELVQRAQNAGYRTLVVTVDSVVNGNREHNRRNGFTIPMRLNARNVIDGALHPGWTLGVMGRYMMTSGMPEFANFPARASHRHPRQSQARAASWCRRTNRRAGTTCAGCAICGRVRWSSRASCTPGDAQQRG